MLAGFVLQVLPRMILGLAYYPCPLGHADESVLRETKEDKNDCDTWIVNIVANLSGSKQGKRSP